MAYWLYKSEPNTFSIDDLKERPNKTEPWDGVRNFKARNYLRQAQVNDLVFFYHSSCEVPGIVGIAKVVKAAYPDKTQFDKQSQYYDAKSTITRPRWYCVDVKFVKKFPHTISLHDLKQDKRLQDMQVTKRGNRLSITPVSEKEWDAIQSLL